MEQRSELAATSKPSDSYEVVVRKWLAVIAENGSKEISPGLVSVWIEAFRGIPIRVLESALKKTLETWRISQIPPIGEILSHIQTANELAEDLGAEKAWEEALRHAQDLGNDYLIASAKEPDDEAMMAGVRAAGGWHWISQCSEEQLIWAKKTFREICAKHKAAPELLRLATTPEGEELRKQIAAIAQRKQLA